MCNSSSSEMSSNFLNVINDDSPRLRANSCNSTLKLSINTSNIFNDTNCYGIPRSNSYSHGLKLNSPILNITNETFTTIISNLKRNSKNFNNDIDRSRSDIDIHNNMDIENEKVFELLCKQGATVPFLK
ncbi:uncharacterized protein LOC129606696 [Condylostylus longicornis]|uniref:uncharacterized protein LOC129606696 n=1 Tax=Condylostylus longicornis TaxID=2530218 RepID=UPI00244E16F6|nr:uncharacterized protein LOC129606696 [Condylostylus longicornis]